MNKNKEDEEYCMLIGSAIRKLRLEYAKKSVCMFAYENDIPRSTLSRIEIGQNEAQLLTLKKIANGFGWKMSELFKKIEENLPDEIISEKSD